MLGRGDSPTRSWPRPRSPPTSPIGARLRAYRFDKYRTKEKPEQKPSLKRSPCWRPSADAARKAFEPLDKIGRARELRPRPGLRAGQRHLSRDPRRRKRRSWRELGVKVEVLGDKEMTKLGMGALLGVGQGSVRESPARRHAVERRQRRQGSKPIAFVGKGVTFDTGGISIKPAAGMEDMKWDMARRRRRDRPDAARWRRARPRSTPSASSAWWRTCRRAPRSGPATSSPRCPARPSR